MLLQLMSLIFVAATPKSQADHATIDVSCRRQCTSECNKNILLAKDIIKSHEARCGSVEPPMKCETKIGKRHNLPMEATCVVENGELQVKVRWERSGTGNGLQRISPGGSWKWMRNARNATTFVDKEAFKDVSYTYRIKHTPSTFSSIQVTCHCKDHHHH